MFNPWSKKEQVPEHAIKAKKASEVHLKDVLDRWIEVANVSDPPPRTHYSAEVERLIKGL